MANKNSIFTANEEEEEEEKNRLTSYKSNQTHIRASLYTHTHTCVLCMSGHAKFDFRNIYQCFSHNIKQQKQTNDGNKKRNQKIHAFIADKRIM